LSADAAPSASFERAALLNCAINGANRRFPRAHQTSSSLTNSACVGAEGVVEDDVVEVAAALVPADSLPPPQPLLRTSRAETASRVERVRAG
jgi:hypothetical protein